MAVFLVTSKWTYGPGVCFSALKGGIRTVSIAYSKSLSFIRAMNQAVPAWRRMKANFNIECIERKF